MFSNFRLAREDSRKEGTCRDGIDLDIVFAISDEPDKEKIHPDLSRKIEIVIKVQAEIGEHRNVINIKKGNLDVDLVLLLINKFESQIINSVT